MLTIKLTLMRVTGATVLAKNFSSAANTVYSLIDYDPVANAEIFYGATRLFNHPTDFVPENLRLQGERDRLSLLVGIVIGVSGKYVGVGTAETDR
jgi:hypothetical protein